MSSFTATDVQKAKLEKLMQNIEKPIEIPQRPKGASKSIEPPDFIRNVMGSSAGAGSGEFHVYRHLRRKEYARQKFIEEQAKKEEADRKFLENLEKKKLQVDAKTAKKRAKRLKKKERIKRARLMKKLKPGQTKGPTEEDTDEEEEESQSDSNSVTEADKSTEKHSVESVSQKDTVGQVSDNSCSGSNVMSSWADNKETVGTESDSSDDEFIGPMPPSSNTNLEQADRVHSAGESCAQDQLSCGESALGAVDQDKKSSSPPDEESDDEFIGPMPVPESKVNHEADSDGDGEVIGPMPVQM